MSDNSDRKLWIGFFVGVLSLAISSTVTNMLVKSTIDPSPIAGVYEDRNGYTYLWTFRGDDVAINVSPEVIVFPGFNGNGNTQVQIFFRIPNSTSSY